MKKGVIFIILLLVIVNSAYAQPAPPLPVQLPDFDEETPTPTATEPTTAPDIQPAEPQPEAQPQPAPQETPAPVQLEETPSSGFPIFYTILIILLILASLGLAVYLFFKYKTKKIVSIPNNVKMYVRTNLQRGYSEGQLRQQLSMQGWSLEQINQIFEEVSRGF